MPLQNEAFWTQSGKGSTWMSTFAWAEEEFQKGGATFFATKVEKRSQVTCELEVWSSQPLGYLLFSQRICGQFSPHLIWLQFASIFPSMSSSLQLSFIRSIKLVFLMNCHTSNKGTGATSRNRSPRGNDNTHNALFLLSPRRIPWYFYQWLNFWCLNWKYFPLFHLYFVPHALTPWFLERCVLVCWVLPFAKEKNKEVGSVFSEWQNQTINEGKKKNLYLCLVVFFLLIKTSGLKRNVN